MYPQRTIWRRWQKGIALITAMLVMSLATVTAVSMSADQQLFFRRTENILHHEQAYMFLLGAEDFGKNVLAFDFTDNKIDSRKDVWAANKDGTNAAYTVPVEGGALGGYIEDLHGRFNINNLADISDKVSLDAFRELLAIYKLPAGLENAVVDWLDDDQTATFPDGAEDVDYMQGERAYRAANGLMGSVSELLYVKGFTYEIYEVIAPALVALPQTGVPINVNTATPAVLRMIVKGLSEQDAESLAKDLAEHPVNEIADFLKNSLVNGKAVPTTGVDVSSSYFMIHAFANIGRARATLDSMVQRSSATRIKTLLRSQGDV